MEEGLLQFVVSYLQNDELFACLNAMQCMNHGGEWSKINYFLCNSVTVGRLSGERTMGVEIVRPVQFATMQDNLHT